MIATSVAHGDGNTRLTIWRGEPSSSAGGFGGYEYGGGRSPSGSGQGFVTQVDEFDVPASGDVTITGLATGLDPATLQVRSVTDPAMVVTAQRFVAAADSPDDALARAIGKAVVVTTTAGELSGVLRAVDHTTLVIEQGRGAELTVTALRRAGNVLRVSLPAGTGAAATPTLRAAVKTSKPGRQTLETTYLTPGLSWRPAYVATLGENGAYDFDAAAVIDNGSATAFPPATVTLVSPTAAGEDTFVLPSALALGAREQVKLDLAPPLRGARGTAITVYEPILERYLVGTTVTTECYVFPTGNGSTRALVELPVPGAGKFPAGTVRVMKRSASGLSLATTGDLEASGDVLRLPTATASKITGAREHKECRLDTATRSLREKIVVTIDNPTADAVDVLVREPMTRAPSWRIDGEDKPGTKSGDRIQEYRVKVAGKAKQVITYTVVYSW